jgi:hypothetical protein
MKGKSWTQVGFLLPAIMVVVLLTDVFLRVVPLNFLAFRALEGVRRHTPSCMGPFEPNASFNNPKSYGDLASLGNLPGMRQYRSAAFSSDSFGFHNPAVLGGVPATIVIGDSFAIGSEVSAEQSFAGQLARLEGRPVYNAGENEPLALAPTRVLIDKLGMTKGVVVYEFLERHLSESPPFMTPTGKIGFKRILPETLGPERWETWRLPVWNALEYSPLQALSGRLQKTLCNGVLLPNRYASNVLVRSLTNGDRMLFLPKDVSDSTVPVAQLMNWRDYWVWLSGELRKENLTLVVMLVPNKFTVYQPYFSPAEKELGGRKNLTELETLLADAHVPSVGLVNAFRGKAAEGLEKQEYLYWKDDTHWNALGMTVAAESVHGLLGNAAKPDGEPVAP